MAWLLATVALGPAAFAQDAEPSPVVAPERDPSLDAQIQDRLSTLLGTEDATDAVIVSVEDGIVTLSGDAPNEAAALQAVAKSQGVEGVLSVEDTVERTLSVRENVTPVLTDLLSGVIDVIRGLPLLLVAGLILYAFVKFAGVLARRKTVWTKFAPNPFLAELLGQAVRLLVVLIGAVVALNVIGASSLVTAVLGGAGVIGVAIGFAVRDTLENYISSIMLSLRQPFRADDHVVINDREGIVVRLTSRATILMTLEGNQLRIPNSVVFKATILNYTANPQRRFDFSLDVDAANDPLGAMQAGVDAIRAQTFVLEAPEPGASLESMGDSTATIKFSGWVDQKVTGYRKARSVVLSSVKQALKDHGDKPKNTPDIAIKGSKGRVGDPSYYPVKTGRLPSPPTTSTVLVDMTADSELAQIVAQERKDADSGNLLDDGKPKE